MIVVTGVARSGTSMMMRMLEHGGMDVLVDEEFTPTDQFNVNGYYEHPEAEHMLVGEPGRDIAVKILARSLPSVLEAAGPPVPVLKFIVMRRDPEIAAQSWTTMVQDRPYEVINPEAQPELHLLMVRGRALVRTRTAAGVLQAVAAMDDALEGHTYLDVLYSAVLESPAAQVDRILEFLGRDLDRDAMAAVVDASLSRY